MKTEIEFLTIQDALKIVPRKPSVPLLRGMAFHDGKCSATDLNLHITVKSNVESNLGVVLCGDKFMQMLKAKDWPKRIAVTISDTGTVLAKVQTVKGQMTQYSSVRMECVGIGDWPVIPVKEWGEPSPSMTPGILGLLQKFHHFTNQGGEMSKDFMQGVKFEKDGVSASNTWIAALHPEIESWTGRCIPNTISHLLKRGMTVRDAIGDDVKNWSKFTDIAGNTLLATKGQSWYCQTLSDKVLGVMERPLPVSPLAVLTIPLPHLRQCLKDLLPYMSKAASIRFRALQGNGLELSPLMHDNIEPPAKFGIKTINRFTFDNPKFLTFNIQHGVLDRLLKSIDDNVENVTLTYRGSYLVTYGQDNDKTQKFVYPIFIVPLEKDDGIRRILMETMGGNMA